MRAFLFLLPVVALPLAACESVKSDEVGTDAMYADLAANAAGDGATALSATLRTGGATSNTFVQLVGGDVLKVNDGGEPVMMSEAKLGDLVSYIASIQNDAAEAAFTFAFERETGDPAPASVATLPAPFALLGPASDTPYSRATDSIEVTWEGGSTDDVRVELHSECIVTAVADAAGDPGTYTFEPGSYEVYDASEDTACEATIRVVRSRTGTLDPAFGGGAIAAAQVRDVGIRLDP